MFPICVGEWIIKALKSEQGQESKEGVPCKVNWKSDLVIENNDNN